VNPKWARKFAIHGLVNVRLWQGNNRVIDMHLKAVADRIYPRQRSRWFTR